MVSKFNNSVLVQKSIKSAIQRLLIFFRLSYGLISTFFSNRAQSWFLNSKILFVFGNRSRARSKENFFSIESRNRSAARKTLNFFQIELWVRNFFVFRSSSELVSKFKNSIRLWKPIQSTVFRNRSSSAIQRLLIFFRLSSGFVIFLFSDRAQSWFLNSTILF